MIWKASDYTLSGNVGGDATADAAYDLVCRTTADSPGFCVIELTDSVDSVRLRAEIVGLKEAFASRHASNSKGGFCWQSLLRFDQQETTKLHRDNGPEQSVLLLGYEPTPIASAMFVADFSACASDRGVTPADFLSKHNPMYGNNTRLLQDYTTTLECFSPHRPVIVMINNSVTDSTSEAGAMLGVLHGATVPSPSDDARRVINSTMFATGGEGVVGPVSEADVSDFLNTSSVRRRGYDKPHLKDDT